MIEVKGHYIPSGAVRYPRFCTAPSNEGADIPLRIRKDLAALALADKDFLALSTEDLIDLARKKHVYVSDRASAIAVLKGQVIPVGE